MSSSRILIIEDNPPVQDVLFRIIESGGFEAEVASTGIHALELFDEQEFDAVLVDLGLPDIDGVELIRRLREQSALPILVVSGSGTDSSRLLALDVGADHFVPKPFRAEELLARIRAALRRWSSVAAPSGR